MPRGFAHPSASPALAGKIGQLRRWSRVNTADERRAALEPANAGRRRRLALEIDPDGTMPAEELAAAIERRQHAHMCAMARASAAKRRK